MCLGIEQYGCLWRLAQVCLIMCIKAINVQKYRFDSKGYIYGRVKLKSLILTFHYGVEVCCNICVSEDKLQHTTHTLLLEHSDTSSIPYVKFRGPVKLESFIPGGVK